MRFVVLLFGLLSVSLTAAAGAGFVMLNVAADMAKDMNVDVPDFLLTSPMGMAHADAGFFLLIAAGYGFLGAIFGFARCGWQGALLLIVPVACTALMNPYTLIFSGPQIFTGLLSFLVFPLPITPPDVDE